MKKDVSPAFQRYENIDIAKAIAIVLVVIGHFSCDYMPYGYDIMRKVIYMFHMPLFMFASGFLYQATHREQPYRQFIAGKFKRLMIPYFTVSLLVICLKLVTKGSLPLENPITMKAFIEIFYYPSAGYFLWFIWALWWMMVIIPAFKSPGAKRLLLAASIAIWFIAPALPEIFCIRQFGQMLVFFAGGTVVADTMQCHRIGSFSISSQLISIILFSGLATVKLCGLIDVDYPIISSIFNLILNISGIAMGFSLASLWSRVMTDSHRRIICSLAANSYLIYLLHTTFEGFAKGVLFKVHWFDWHPQLLTSWLGAAIVVACGVAIPWWLGTRILNRWAFTSQLFGIKNNIPTFKPSKS